MRKGLDELIKKVFPRFINFAPAKSGGNSENFSAEDQTGSRFFIKCVSLEKLRDRKEAHSFEDERDALLAVESPYVVKLLDFKKDDNYAYFVFRHEKGESLKDYIKRRVEEKKIFSEKEIEKIALDLLRGLKDLQSAGVVHQDIKPANIFIRDDGRTMILDLGICRFKSPPNKKAKANYKYAAPEQIISLVLPPRHTRANMTYKADIFALGLILFELAAGEHPYENLAGEYTFHEAIAEKHPIPSIKREDISPFLREQVIPWMIEHLSYDRPSAEEAMYAISQQSIPKSPAPKPLFLYQVPQKGTKSILKFLDEYPNKIDGVIVPASKIPKKTGKMELMSSVRNILIDPETYRMPEPTASEAKKKLPYFESDPVALSEERKMALVEQALQYQFKNGATHLITPFVCINEFKSSWWDLDVDLTTLSLKHLSSSGQKKHPILKGVCIGQDALLATETRQSLLSYLTSISGIAGYYLVLEAKDSGELISNDDWLVAAGDVVKNLTKQGRTVIWAYADLSTFGFCKYGISMGLNEFMAGRRFKSEIAVENKKKSFGPPVEYFYLPDLFARAKFPDAVNLIVSNEKELECFCLSCCKAEQAGGKFSSARSHYEIFSHFLLSVQTQWKLFSSQADGPRVFLEQTVRALSFYRKMKNSTSLRVRQALQKDTKPSSGLNLENWLKIFPGI